MKLFPIVALVNQDVIDEVAMLANTWPGPSDEIVANGWTLEEVMAGSVMMAWLSQRREIANLA